MAASPESSYDPLDAELDALLAASDGDLTKVYTKYQEEFFHKYNQSLQLAAMEKSQRQLLHYYIRRNNAILDALDETNDISAESFPENAAIPERLANVVAMNPQLGSILAPLLGKDGESDLPSLKDTSLSNTLKINLLLTESVSELEVDDLISVEKNPQDIEFWLRRNQPNLVLSRFKPISFKDNRLIKLDSSLDNLNSNLNLHLNPTNNKRRRKQ